MAEKSERAKREEKILQFWKEHKIFEKTLDKEAPNGDFVFYEGPPTANGKPAIHHLEARAFKDAIPRYKTMRGYRVSRKAGWDTHGLPVELEVEKTLGLKSKKEIEEYGIAKFNKECKASVQKYIGDWAKFTDRIGYWVNLDEAYFTYDNSYIESIWSILSHVEKRKLLYKDYKVVPWCPRCGTVLSSHELAQGYQDVKDLSLYVKLKIIGFPDAYFLAWTTTPWTLPGNVALAVGEDIEYVEAKVGEEIFVLAKDKLSIITEPYEIVAEHKGKEIAGMEYEPPYPFVRKTDKTFKVYSAGFVNIEDGTGIVHTAVMYGHDDFELGTKEGLPKTHLVSPDGTFIKGTDWLEGRSVTDDSLSIDILKDLQERRLLFGKENHQHSYPFCWRCKTRLVYYARDSWYIKMSVLREKLMEENQKINWEPEHIKDGRFGEWLKEVKDWAVSRERYWGTPLPIWQNADDSKRIVVDSIETLKKYVKKSGNSYFVMRHAEAKNNANNIPDLSGDPENHLTEKGKNEAKAVALDIKNSGIDIIITSPFLRTNETAVIMQKELGLPDSSIIVDNRLHEIGPDEDGIKIRQRMGEFIFDVERQYREKNILIISHGFPIWSLSKIVAKQPIDLTEQPKPMETAEIRKLPFVAFPHNEDFELDLHRPYVDDIVLVKGREEYRRVKEVLDVWFDSGAMPFAQDPKSILYPADFISEAIDQTRGWFYTLHAIGILMERGLAYKNVICLGHLLDKEGKKMSKSIGNVVDPWEEMEKHGVDALRFWIYSVNQPGESKNFDSGTVAEIGRKIFNILDNVYAFYELYRNKELETNTDGQKPEGNLDRWILSRFNELVTFITERFDKNKFKTFDSTRNIGDFINDFSTWYLQASRERIKNGDNKSKQTLYFVLKGLSKIMAPFTPFFAEDLYQKLRVEGEPESVHLCAWPTQGKFDNDLLNSMEITRNRVSHILKERSNAGIKVRQPIISVTLKTRDAHEEIIKERVNAKNIVVDKSIDRDIIIDTNLTPELIEEGKVRDAIRAIQDLRKEKGLRPDDKMMFTPPTGQEEFFKNHRDEIRRATNIEFN